MQTATQRPVKPLSTTPDALEEVFQTHHRRMLQAAYRITGDAQDAEDVLQTVFVRLLKRGAPLEVSTDTGAYLQRAAVNAALDLVRRRQRATVIPFEDAGAQPTRDATSRPEGRFTEAELVAWLRRRVAAESPMAAEIFVLRHFEDFTNQEIADVLGTTPNSVAVILHRTHSRLRQALARRMGDG